MRKFTMELAESLGVIILCNECTIAVATWNPDLLRWEDEDGDPCSERHCGGCNGEVVGFPSAPEVESFMTSFLPQN